MVDPYDHAVPEGIGGTGARIVGTDQRDLDDVAAEDDHVAEHTSGEHCAPHGPLDPGPEGRGIVVDRFVLQRLELLGTGLEDLQSRRLLI